MQDPCQGSSRLLLREVGVERDRPQPGQLVAAAGAAEKDRRLVLDQLTAAIGEDGWPIDQARPVSLAAVGRESSDAAIVWEHGAADRRAAL